MGLQEAIDRLEGDNPHRMVEQQRWLYHGDQGYIGRASKFHEPGSYVDVNGSKVAAAVMEFQDGSTLVWDPERWVELSDSEAQFFEGLTQGLGHFVAGAAKGAHERKMEKRTFLHIMRGVLRNQTSAIASVLASKGPGADAY